MSPLESTYEANLDIFYTNNNLPLKMHVRKPRHLIKAVIIESVFFALKQTPQIDLNLPIHRESLMKQKAVTQ